MESWGYLLSFCHCLNREAEKAFFFFFFLAPKLKIA